MDRPRRPTRWAVKTLVTLGVVAVGAAGWTGVASPEPEHDEDPDLRAIVAALAVARHAGSLAGTASARTRADMSPEEMAASRASIDADAAKARRHLDVLATTGREEEAARMHALLDELTRGARQLEDGRAELARVLRDSEDNRRELIAATSWQLLPAAVASEDDLFHRMFAGRDATAGATDAVAVDDLLLYARLALLTQQVDQGYIALEVATRLSDREFIGTVEENVNLVMYQLRENIESFSDADREALDSTLVPLARDLVDAAYGETNLIDLMKTRLKLDEREAQLGEAVDTVSSALRREVDAVLERAIGTLERMDATRDTAKALQAALAVRQHAFAAAAQASRRTTADTPVVELPEMRDAVAAHVARMRQGLDALGDAGFSAATAVLDPKIDHVESVGERIHDGRAALVDALQSAARQRAQLRSFMDHRLEPAVVGSLDNQLYYMLTGRSEFRDGVVVESAPLSRSEFLSYWHLASVHNSLFRTFSGLIIAIIMTEPTMIGEGEERFATASHRLEKSIDFLEGDGGAELDPQLVPLARQFIAFGNGDSNVFDSLRHRLPLAASERESVEVARRVHADLQGDIDALLDRILQDAALPAGASRDG